MKAKPIDINIDKLTITYIKLKTNISEVGVVIHDLYLETYMSSVFFFRKTQLKKSKCLLRHSGLRVFVSFCVLVFVRAILSWCPLN